MTSLPLYSESLGAGLYTTHSHGSTDSDCPCPPRRPTLPRNRSSSGAAPVNALGGDSEPSRALFQGVPPVFIDRPMLRRASSAESVRVVEEDVRHGPSVSGRPGHGRRESGLYTHAEMYERLVAGQESENGEAPPAYDAVA
jgi:hypothetical protein